MRLIRIFVASLARSAQRKLSHSANLLFEGLLAVINTLAGIAAIAVLFTQTESLAGWRRESVIVLLGTFQIMTGLMWTFVEPNLGWFGSKVKSGELDDVLLQPVPSLFTISLGGCNPWSLLTLLSGIAVMLIGVAALHVQVTAANLLAFVVLLGAGAVLMWASRVAVACVAFWAQGFEPDVLYGALWQLGRIPRVCITPLCSACC
jgi:ABC-2 type transport system permease protein